MLEVTTPLQAIILEAELRQHPDPQFALNGIKNGFRVMGCDRETLLRNCMVSALNHPQVVNDYLQQELLLNRIVSIPEVQVPNIQCYTSPFGVIPTKSKPGQWRLIVDLSSPANASVNDGIEKNMCSISYISVDQVSDCMPRHSDGKSRHQISLPYHAGTPRRPLLTRGTMERAGFGGQSGLRSLQR